MSLEGESGRLEGWQAIEGGLQTLLIEALQGGARRLTVLDPDFVHWPWSNPELLHELALWVRAGHRLEMLALDYEACARRHPRFMAWRAHHDHGLLIRSYEPGEVGPQALLGGLAAQPGPVLQILEREDGRARWTRAGPHLASDRQLALENFDAIAQRSGPAWPLTTLGL
ncbi:hypothetical protein HNQ51_001320 [Inhella inkyongensis]|uniref:Uncharacterized protein n=1 Tax=Inhella inkyongensis TaxID=392593 RepID=A0A840RZ27_9BURK|nr:hypothetical protein [Inhella inkyongensis]